MIAQSMRHYQTPKDVPGSKDYFSYYLWITQVQQGRCLQVSFEKQRRARSVPDVKNMGALYWQINTDWQAPSWSTLDYSGNWKASHNMVQDLFENVIVSPYFYNNTLHLWVVSDLVVPLHNASFTLELFTYDQNTAEPQSTIVFFADIAAASSAEVAHISNKELFGANFTESNCFVRVSADHNSTLLARSHAWPLYMINQTIPPALSTYLHADVYAVKITDNSYAQAKIIIGNSVQPSIFTTLESEEIAGYFSKNVITLLPGEQVEVIFTAKHPIENLAEKLRSTLVIKSYN